MAVVRFNAMVVNIKLYPRKVPFPATLQGMTTYHAWAFYKNENGNTIIFTDECQTGPFARENKDMLTKAVYDTHQRWLEGLIS